MYSGNDLELVCNSHSMQLYNYQFNRQSLEAWKTERCKETRDKYLKALLAPLQQTTELSQMKKGNNKKKQAERSNVSTEGNQEV